MLHLLKCYFLLTSTQFDPDDVLGGVDAEAFGGQGALNGHRTVQLRTCHHLVGCTGGKEQSVSIGDRENGTGQPFAGRRRTCHGDGGRIVPVLVLGV